MSRIQQLSATVINKIAAGEVIERPASVVKELLENSVDALSSRIEVEIADGGTELIRVVDDGEGIHPDDLLLSVTSHATSKIVSDEDLFSVATMGFRGEALASIASVSRFHVRTRRADQAQGIELEVNGGVNGIPQPCGCPVGTSIEVRQLFANTPVRRKFLRTVNTEAGHVSEQFSRIAIANPRLHMTLRHNGRIVYELPSSARLIDRLRFFYGSDLADNLIEVESEVTAEDRSAEPIRLWGYVAHPNHSKSNRKGQYLFLNGRWIQDRSLQHALTESYRGLLMVNRFPIAYLFLELPPHLVDVNVHPSKSEVRFRSGQQLYRQLLSTVRNKFLTTDLDGRMELPGEKNKDNESEFATSNTIPEQTAQQLELGQELNSWSDRALNAPAATVTSANLSAPNISTLPVARELQQEPAFADSTGTSVLSPAEPNAPAPVGDPRFISSAVAQQTATDADAAPDSARETAVAAKAERAFQIHDCYLVVATSEGLTVIDQHALHERILYEYFRTRILDGSVESQKLLVPESIDFSPKEAALLIEHQELLAEIGFTVEEFGGSTILVTSYPVMLSRANRTRMIRDIVDELDKAGGKPSRRDVINNLLNMMACKAAIKAGQRLSPEEIDSLLEQRHLCDDHHHCPHGRPTALVLTQQILDKQFGRLG